jgi:hypothetical protein
MVPRTAASGAPHPDAVEFVRFCYHRRRVGWPELYDEMCAVAGRGLFRGFNSDDLGGIGVGFSLFDMPALANLACRVVAEESAPRRPMTVVLAEVIESESTSAPRPEPSRATGAPNRTATSGDDRTFDVPIRLALAPAGA